MKTVSIKHLACRHANISTFTDLQICRVNKFIGELSEEVEMLNISNMLGYKTNAHSEKRKNNTTNANDTFVELDSL